jgi:integrase
LQAVALSVGKEARLDVDRGTAGFMRLVEAVQRALVEHYGREADRSALGMERAVDPLFADVSKGRAPPASGLTLEEAVELFKGAPERANVAAKTRTAYNFRCAVLIELLGAKTSVAEITRANLRDARDVLSKLPPNAQKRFPKMSLQRVATYTVEKGIAAMSPKSAVLYLHAANALFRWLVSEELAPKNPAAGLKGPALPEETNRRPFTDAELNKLFRAREFNGAGPLGRDWLFWLPRVALFTGARFAELVALRAAGVIEVDGVTVLSIAPNADRKLKNKGSKRLVPVHSALVELGLVEHARKVSPNGLLFPDAAGPKDMLNARNKEIGRKLRAVLPDEALVFHSFRHSFKDAGQRARIPRELLALIGGWEVEGGRAAIDSYRRDPLVKILSEEMGKISFGGLGH